MAKEIFIYGNIGYDWWTGGGITAESFIRELKAAENSNEEIRIRINSPGGDLFEGIAIHNAVLTSPAHDRITTRNDGIAYSMAADILLAGKTVEALENATTLIHTGRGSAYGTASAMEDAARMLRKLDESQAISIASKTKKTVAEVQELWLNDRDHTLSAAEAKEAGLVDTIIPLRAENIPDNLEAMTQRQLFAAYAKMQKPSEQEGFIAKLFSKIEALIKPAATEPIPTQPTEEDMKVKIFNGQTALAAALAVVFAQGEESKEVEISAEQLEALDSKLRADEAALATANAEKKTAEDNLAIANAEIEKLKKTPAASQTPISKGDPNPEAPAAIVDSASQKAEAYLKGI